MIDFDSLLAHDLSLNMDLAGRHLIEASAGTGKTFTIAGLYARLIAERQLPVREVLVITFTRAAADELRQRLRHRLELCATWATQPAADPTQPLPPLDNAKSALALALVRRVRERGEEAPEALAKRLRMAVLDMDQAAIGTIDSFCQRVLRTWSMYLDAGIDGAELDPNDDELLEDFAADTWLRAAHADNAGLTLDSLKLLGHTPAGLAQLLSGLVYFDGSIEPELPDGPDDDASLPDMEAARAALFAAWHEHGSRAIAQFEAAFGAGHLNKASYKADKPARLRQLSAALAAGREPPADALTPFAWSKLDRGTKKDFKPFPDQPAFAAIDTWLEAQAAREAVLRRRAVRTLHALVAEARQWLDRRKRDLRRISYADPLVWLEQGLLHGSRRDQLAAALRQQYRVALIDEFQDTNPRQFRIFETVCGADGGLFLIGDPKQAIYGFRGGDVFAYLKAAAEERKADRCIHSLDRNFRSSPGLLRAVESLFTQVDDPFAQSGIAFEHVAPGGKVADGMLRIGGAPVTPMTLWPVDKESVGAKVDDRRECLADLCAAQVAELVSQGTLGDTGAPVQPGGIAVLVNSNDEAMRVRDALQQRGVPAVCVQRRSVYASREAAELLQLLDALLEPSSLRLARGALATELLGRRLSEVTDEDTVLRAALTELDDLREAWTKRGLMAMLEELAERHAPRLLALADGERLLVNTLQLAEALASDARQLAGGRALREALAQHIRDADARNEAEQLRLESDAERVQVLTLHGSKGLEYDVVLMPFAALMDGPGPTRGEAVNYHDDEGTPAACLLLHASGECKSAQASPEALAEGEVRRRAEAEYFAERMRLLYVGVTRARHACWLSVGMGKVMGHLLPNPETVQALVEQSRGTIRCQSLEPPVVATMPSRTSARLAQARQFTGTLARDWWVHSFSQLAAGERDTVAAVAGAADEADRATVERDAALDAPVPVWPRGPRYGNVVHAVLEKTAMAAWKQGADCPDSEHPLLVRELRAAGFEGEDLARALPPTIQLVRQSVLTPILPGLCLADLDPADRRAEMPFHFGMAGAAYTDLLALLHAHGYQKTRDEFAHARGRLRGMMTGIIDLTFRHGGQWWIVDYKTNLLGTTRADYASERLPAAIATHDYDLQYLIYTVALHRWLRLMRGAAWDYARDFGGVRYLFVRGMAPDAPMGHAIHAVKPPVALVQAVDALLHAPGESA